MLQLAGDLLPNATTDEKIATGFNRNHMINFEGGAIPEEYQVEYVVDRANTTATTFLGVTMGCARCHDHKDVYKRQVLFTAPAIVLLTIGMACISLICSLWDRGGNTQHLSLIHISECSSIIRIGGR